MDREELADPDAAGELQPDVAADPAPLRPPFRPAPPSGLELVADLAPPGALAAALQSVREAGVDLLDALLTRPEADGDAVIRRLGRRLGLSVLTAADPLPAAPTQATEEVAAALRAGLLRLADGRIAVAARSAALRRLVKGGAGPVAGRRIVLATPRRFADLVMVAGGPDFVRTQRDALEAWAPHLSGRPLVVGRSAAAALAALVALAVIVLVRAPLVGHVVLSLFFLLLAGIRLAAAAIPARAPRAPTPVDPHDLPVYSVIVPLYRESRAFAGLLDALAALDYPAAKLDIKLLVESGDAETARALAAQPLAGHIEVLRLPPGQPRTKPRALNVGLAAARGAFLVVFDAEDRPDPGQLRAALAAFAAGPPLLACVQAQLTVDNGRDSWLTRMFTVEYAALFDAFLPNLAALGLPFPLGGSSNHFRGIR
jgi:hypothetical protein